jgi:hypothetical protein
MNDKPKSNAELQEEVLAQKARIAKLESDMQSENKKLRDELEILRRQVKTIAETGNK